MYIGPVQVSDYTTLRPAVIGQGKLGSYSGTEGWTVPEREGGREGVRERGRERERGRKGGISTCG